MHSCGYGKLILSGVIATVMASGSCASQATGSVRPSDSEQRPAPKADPAADDPAAAVAEAPPLDEEEAWEGEREAVGSARGTASAVPTGTRETRTLEVIQKIVQENRQAVRDCYERALATQPSLRGELVIHFVLDAQGRVQQAELNADRSTLAAASVATCAADAIRAIEFPPSSRGRSTTVNYPFTLAP